MSTTNRLKRVVSSKINAILNRLENPVEELERALEQNEYYGKQLKEAVIDVKTSINLLKQQKIDIDETTKKADEAITKYREQDKPELAEMLEKHKAELLSLIGDIDAEILDLESEEKLVKEESEKYKLQLNCMRISANVAKTRYTVSKTRVNASESSIGIGNTDTLDEALSRIKEKTKFMKARAQAISEFKKETKWMDNI